MGRASSYDGNLWMMQGHDQCPRWTKYPPSTGDSDAASFNRAASPDEPQYGRLEGIRKQEKTWNNSKFEGWAASRSPSRSPAKWMSSSSLPEGLPKSRDFVEEGTDNHTVSSIEAVASVQECHAPLLSEEQCLPGLHGNFRSSRPWKE